MHSLPTHPEDIKAAIRKRFGSLAAFERERELPADSARDVLRGKSVARTAEAIAKELDVSVHKLFPGRFASLNRDGDNSDQPPAHRQNAGGR